MISINLLRVGIGWNLSTESHVLLSSQGFQMFLYGFSRISQLESPPSIVTTKTIKVWTLITRCEHPYHCSDGSYHACERHYHGKRVCAGIITNEIGCDCDCDYKIFLLGYTLITVVILLITLARDVITALTAGVIHDDCECDYKIFLLKYIFITSVINLISHLPET